MIPLYIRILAKFIPLLKWDINLAVGEIRKFNFVKSQKNKHSFNEQVIGFEEDFDLIWRHIANDWFKNIGKSPSRSC